MSDNIDIGGGGPHWLLKTVVLALIGVAINAVLGGSDPLSQLAKQVAAKAAERAIENTFSSQSSSINIPRITDERDLRASVNAGASITSDPTTIKTRQVDTITNQRLGIKTANNPSSLQWNSNRNSNSHVFDFDPSPQPIVRYENLQIFSGAQFTLEAGTEYLLIAPLGFSVQYSMIAGYAYRNRDGQFFRHCKTSSFVQHAERSIFSVIPCSQKAILKVEHITADNLLSGHSYAGLPETSW